MAESEAPHVRGFLFADLRGFTQFVEQHGDRAAAELLKAYRTFVRAAVARFSGAEIRTEGDGFYVVFPSPSSAIRCAIAILDEAASSTAAAGMPIPVGIGIHAGETDDSAEGFVGSAVNIAARVCALAGSGEVLITETVRGLVRTSMPLAIEPRGRRHLKGIREPIALFGIRATGAAPPSRSRRLRSRVLSLERRPVLVAFAALAGVAAVATVVLAVGLLSNTKASPGAGRLGGSAPSASGTTAPTASDPGVFPNAAEQALLARLDSSIASFCGRAATTEYPRWVAHRDLGGATPDRLPVQAGLRCVLGGSRPDTLFLWDVAPLYGKTAFSDQQDDTARSWFFQQVSATPLSDCAKADQAFQYWSFGVLKGALVCRTTTARARIDWIYDGDHVIATAVRDDADRAALYRWWLDEGRVLLH